MAIFTFLRIIKYAFQGFWRNFWLSIVTISVIVLAFISVNSLIVINHITESALRIIQERIDISIHFKSDVNELDVVRAKEFLTSLTQVEKVDYISKEQALENFRIRHKDDPNILAALEELNENPFSAMLRVKAKNIEDYETILEFINNSEFNSLIYNKNFQDQKEVIEKLQNISFYINRFGIAISIFFTIIALLIVYNIIKLTIYAQREEFGIMKLVGASNSFVILPYIVESMLYAIIGFLIGLITLFVLLDFVHPYIVVFLQSNEIDIRQFFQQNLIAIFGLELTGLIFLNVISSIIAIQRYLRV